MPRGRVKQFDVSKLVKLTTEQAEAVRTYAERSDVNDSEAIRRLIELGLQTHEERAEVDAGKSGE